MRGHGAFDGVTIAAAPKIITNPIRPKTIRLVRNPSPRRGCRRREIKLNLRRHPLQWFGVQHLPQVHAVLGKLPLGRLFLIGSSRPARRQVADLRERQLERRAEIGGTGITFASRAGKTSCFLRSSHRLMVIAPVLFVFAHVGVVVTLPAEGRVIHALQTLDAVIVKRCDNSKRFSHFAVRIHN